ncbi:hypothetical protein CLU97_2620 [Chryseobacterium sp. 7]|nr:hypothetical protein CLU97_2620 [Chryseobacterium sp. 7]
MQLYQGVVLKNVQNFINKIRCGSIKSLIKPIFNYMNWRSLQSDKK